MIHVADVYLLRYVTGILGPKAAKLSRNGTILHSDNSNPIFNEAIIIPDCVNDLRYNTVFLADSITF